MTRNRCVAAAAVLLMACVAGCNSSPTSSTVPNVGTTVGKEAARPKTGERSAPVEAVTVPGKGK